NLSGAVLRGANLRGANLLCAIVENTQWGGACLDEACLDGTPLESIRPPTMG
ncbi:pentapeptide repeat-containing protein, partial [Arthrospira platensis SPKY2]